MHREVLSIARNGKNEKNDYSTSSREILSLERPTSCDCCCVSKILSKSDVALALVYSTAEQIIQSTHSTLYSTSNIRC